MFILIAVYLFENLILFVGFAGGSGTPVQCSNGHIYCKVCLEKHMHENGRSCPVCRVVIPANLSRSLLAEVSVRAGGSVT